MVRKSGELRKRETKTARILFGILYLGGAITNITLTVLNSPQFYYGFADRALIPFYRDAWMALVVPNMTLFISLLVLFEMSLGLLFLVKRQLLWIALLVGALFCLGTAPFGIEAVYTNIPLGLIQLFLLWRELRIQAREAK